MATIKSYTDLEQSKRLAEILPIESADMCFNTRKSMPPLMTPYSRFNEFFDMEPTPTFLIPCWSLAALLGVIPKRIDEFNVLRMDLDDNDFAIWYDEMGGKTNFGVNSKLPDITMASPIDACVEMILKLHEENLI